MGVIKDELSSIFKVSGNEVSYRDTVQPVFIGVGDCLLMVTMRAEN